MATTRQKIYYPDFQITKNLYTHGGEWMTEDNVEYIGAYHKYTDGSVFTRGTYDDMRSRRLVPFIVYSEPRMGAYDVITKRIFRTNTPVFPTPAAPTDLDYEHGWFMRYFAKKINDTQGNIIEVSSKTEALLHGRGSTEAVLYQTVKIKWMISGPLSDQTINNILYPGVIDENRRTVAKANFEFPGLSLYLLNFREFYK